MNLDASSFFSSASLLRWIWRDQKMFGMATPMAMPAMMVAASTPFLRAASRRSALTSLMFKSVKKKR